jgi:hypothetical protein
MYVIFQIRLYNACIKHKKHTHESIFISVTGANIEGDYLTKFHVHPSQIYHVFPSSPRLVFDLTQEHIALVSRS